MSAADAARKPALTVATAAPKLEARGITKFYARDGVT
jgi:hypothetical protein